MCVCRWVLQGVVLGGLSLAEFNLQTFKISTITCRHTHTHTHKHTHTHTQTPFTWFLAQGETGQTAVRANGLHKFKLTVIVRIHIYTHI